ncbi:hypothetical protein H206_05391 [Candidatus Electrothrix aarhusensis]|uniref:Uncharacterized protein n=1 Tax=Candidatus Electrothrix aarhusensis TaxID=1859131 RepID=A0A3S3UBI9_9BACT|nr:hypothetical protein H206_05391 [Candidatus Electrothrix aarhusensis]
MPAVFSHDLFHQLNRLVPVQSSQFHSILCPTKGRRQQLPAGKEQATFWRGSQQLLAKVQQLGYIGYSGGVVAA